MLELIRRLRDQGVPVILITHTMPDVFAVADRIVVMHRGRKVTEEADRAKTNDVELVQYMVGALDDNTRGSGLGYCAILAAAAPRLGSMVASPTGCHPAAETTHHLRGLRNGSPSFRWDDIENEGVHRWNTLGRD